MAPLTESWRWMERKDWVEEPWTWNFDLILSLVHCDLHEAGAQRR